jgi:predicted MPP superfamily phosphohydrolase
MPFVFLLAPVLPIFIAGQLYWILTIRKLLRRFFHRRDTRIVAGSLASGVYLVLFAWNLLGSRGPTPTRMTIHDALVVAPFQWWIFSSTLGFLVVVVIWLARAFVRGLRWMMRAFHSTREKPSSPARREFLEYATLAAGAGPFVAGAYGLLWGRLNLEVTRQPIVLARLPRAFHGFKIAQLSDIHVGPFMSEDEIRKYVRITNALRPDMVVLTGDFVTWDARTQDAVVRALSGLRAPFGVFGCLGNHDAWARAEESLAELFARTGIRLLRQENLPIRMGADSFNLMGIDFANSRSLSAGEGHLASTRLEGVEKLMMPDTANILLSHNPDTFDRAASLGIDLSLAGHTHGGQLALEFISPELAPSRIVTPYVAGHFQQPGGQLYVNRGIGTIAAPMRVGAPPEITVFELKRGYRENAVTDSPGNVGLS